MRNEAFQLFLLMTTLARLRDERRTKELFLESLDSIFPDLHPRWTGAPEVAQGQRCLDVCTSNASFGEICVDESAIASSSDFALLQNAAQMLASILEKQQQEQLLEEQNLRLEALVEERTQHLQQTLGELDQCFNNALDLFCVVDVAGKFVRLNHQWEVTLGYPLGSLVGRDFMAYVHAEDIERTAENMRDIVNNRTVVDFVNRYQRKDGAFRWIEWRAFVHGELIYAAARDITERRKIDESLQRTQRLESVALLAGGIAHDFNNLLSGIFGFMELAQQGLQEGDTADALECIKMAQQVFERARALTQQLLTFSRGGAPMLSVVQIGSLVRRCADFALSGSNVACQYRIGDDLWDCDCDENQIGQVIDNLVINAKDAMPNGGLIVLSAENVATAPGLPQNGRFVRISFCDNGPGIPPEIRGQIFDPFFTTKKTGHGLGLATVYSIVKRHNGVVDVDSELGKGTEVRVYLPASKNRSVRALPSTVLPLHRGGLVLIMDDEPFVLDFLSRMLRGLGHEVVVASDGQQAFDQFVRLESSGTRVSLCILDLTVPGGMGGVNAASKIHEARADTIIVAASGYADDPVMASPEKFGFAASLRKPFRRDALATLVEQLLSKSSASAAQPMSATASGERS